MKKLYLSESDKKIAGVCGGIGETYGVDSTLVRLVWVFIGLATAGLPALVTYIVAWIIIPSKPKQ
jgi:phage shock protein C